MAKAVYPGSFDPVTYGHLDILERAAAVFSEVNVAVIANPNKNPLFTLSQRVEMLTACTSHLPNVTISQFEGLLVQYVQDLGAKVIIKGLRTVSDFEYEFQMALMNREQSPDIETFFMMTNSCYCYLSSSLVKEVFCLGGNVHDFVPPLVEAHMRRATGGDDVPPNRRTC